MYFNAVLFPQQKSTPYCHRRNGNRPVNTVAVTRNVNVIESLLADIYLVSNQLFLSDSNIDRRRPRKMLALLTYHYNLPLTRKFFSNAIVNFMGMQITCCKVILGGFAHERDYLKFKCYTVQKTCFLNTT